MAQKTTPDYEEGMMEKLTVTAMRHTEFEELVKAAYGLTDEGYEFVDVDTVESGASYFYRGIDGNPADCDAYSLRAALDSKDPNDATAILQDLVRTGVLEAGNLVIEVNW